MASTSKCVVQRGAPLKSQTRAVVFNIYEYLRNIKEEFCMDINIFTSISEATGISRSAVARIIREGKMSTSNLGVPTFITPKKCKGGRQKRIEVEDEFPETVVRRKILEFYAVRKEIPTLDKILHSLQNEEDILNCSREYIRLQIQKVGFTWKKCHTNKKLLMEKPEITAWRWKYLKRMRKFRNANRNIVYLDETYIQAVHTVQHCWETLELTGPNSFAKGDRLIIVNAGGESGFIPNALLIYIYNTNYTTMNNTSSIYNGNMNETNFTNWLRKQLIPNLPPESVVVLDNASYHCVQRDKRPTSVSLKSEISEWLVEKGISHSMKMRKHKLLQLCQQVNLKKSYIIDELLKSHGHETLRLPPNHPDLNPIELVWRRIRSRVAVECPSTNLNEKKQFCEQIFKEYTPAQWAQSCEYVKRIEQIYWDRDSVTDSVIDQLLINIGGASDSSDEDWGSQHSD